MVGTRERILSACRALFNERGPAQVTTAEIAGAVGIAEGNLHYHFQRKEQIIEALFDDYAEATRHVAISYACDDPQIGAATARHGAYLAAWFNLMWEWRVFYRDGAAFLRLAPGLKPRWRALGDEAQAEVLRAFDAMIAEGLLEASREEIGSLIVNVWIVSAFWLEYLLTMRGVTIIERQHLDWGAKQVQSLLAPYLTRTGRTIFD